jgi:hypothetical protein
MEIMRQETALQVLGQAPVGLLRGRQRDGQSVFRGHVGHDHARPDDLVGLPDGEEAGVPVPDVA